MYVVGWEMHIYGLSQCLLIGALIGGNNPLTWMSWSELKLAHTKRERVKSCDVSSQCQCLQQLMPFFTNANKSSVPATVPELSEAAMPSTSFLTVAEINNVDVPGASN